MQTPMLLLLLLLSWMRSKLYVARCTRLSRHVLLHTEYNACRAAAYVALILDVHLLLLPLLSL